VSLSTTAGTAELPESFAQIVEDFQGLSQPERLQLLLEFSQELPALPDRFTEHRDAMEPVPECQSPVFLAVEVAAGGERTVNVFFDAPREAPTTRGFASILAAGLDGLTAAQVLAVPDDVPSRLGLTAAVSPLRLRGMAGLIKRQVARELAAALSPDEAS
jgi:cysteine desulfuration protein SufE